MLAGCEPVSLWWQERNRPPEPQVVALPADYDPATPLPPYQGPHPSRIGWQPDPSQYPVRPGAVGPIDESLGPLQYPFSCDTEASGLGPPLIDNQAGEGTPVMRDGVTQGFSKDCLAATRIDLYYRPVGDDHLQRYDETVAPTDIHWITLEGTRVPFVLRVERGTINRFIYYIAVLADPTAPLEQPDLQYWNGRLIYHFRGGVGIGKRQGRVSPRMAFDDLHDALARGYAVAFSSGNRTGTHYNMWLAGQTAAMVKAQFRAAYGEPKATIGIGASGGGVQQYLLAQNHPGLLDGLIPIYSYPDMITQTNWALDCELLEYYFDVTADNDRWHDQIERTLVSGLAASNEITNGFSALQRYSLRLNFKADPLPAGATECALSWRGLSPLVNNPRYLSNHRRYTRAVTRQERWSHWHDLRLIYGVGADGFAHRTWSNEGVQYGLAALRAGHLSPAEFLHLNASIGSWKAPRDMRPERYWVFSGPLSRDSDFRDISIWSEHNMQRIRSGRPKLARLVPQGTTTINVAPRRRADAGAVAAAFHGGQVYLGRTNLPTLDVRHYLDPWLDMHHSFASLSVRARMQATNNPADQHVIWMAEQGDVFIDRAIEVMRAWLDGERPDLAVDACFDAQGNVIAHGAGVRDGAWNQRPVGACAARFPPYQSPRNVAGEPMTGDFFECPREPVSAALAGGRYAPVDMAPYANYLAQIFPHGVCDYTQPEAGRPTWQALLAP